MIKISVNKFRLESYYKDFDDLIVSDPEMNYINSGSGYSYGFDF